MEPTRHRRRHAVRLGLFATAIVTALAAAPAAANAQTTPPSRHVVDLGTLGGTCCGEAKAINRQGDIVGQAARADGQTHAFRWHEGRMTDLGTLGGNYSSARAINDRGDVVGYSTTASSDSAHAFLWRAGTMTELTPTLPYSLALDINDRGVVAGSVLAGTGSTVGARWRHGVLTTLDERTGDARAINNRGHTTGLAKPSGHSFLIAGGRYTDIFAPDAVFVETSGINSHDDVVGKSQLGAFVWRHGRFTWLPALGSSAGATAINDKGQVVGWAATDHGGNPHAVLWTF